MFAAERQMDPSGLGAGSDDGSSVGSGCRSSGGMADGALIAVAAFAAYILFGQSTEFIDSSGYLLSSSRGINGDTRHVNFGPMLIAWCDAAKSLLPISHLEAARSFCAFMSAITVVMAHAAGRVVKFDRARAATFAGLVACTPVVAFCGTVVGPYSALAALASIAFLLVALAARTGRIGVACAVGLVTGLASTVHATGNLLPALTAPVVFALRRGFEPHRWFARALSLGSIVLVSHGVVVVAYNHFAPTFGLPTGAGSSADFVLTLAGSSVQSLDQIPHTLVYEWLLPLLPVSVLLPVTMFRRGVRFVGALIALNAVGYLTMTFVLVQGGTAAGAYMLSVGWMSAFVVVAAFGTRVRFAAIVIAAITAVAKIELHDEPGRVIDYAAGLQEVTGGAPSYLVIGIGEDVDSIFAALPEQEFFCVQDLVQHPAPTVAAALPAFGELIAGKRAEGCQVLLTAAARAWLDKLADWPTEFRGMEIHNGGPVFSEYLERTYTLEAVAARGFRGERLEPK